MPIIPHHAVTRLSQPEFREVSYAVMGHLFEIHNEFGRFFDERIYKQELACRMSGVELEFPVTVSHQGFTTTCFVDAMIAGGAPFEFKAVEVLTPRHQGQLYNYLLLLDLAHGKLVNMRPETIEHEFVNATIRPTERHRFILDTDRWSRSLPGAGRMLEAMSSLLQDWGVGLELGMYEAALTHFLGGEQQVVRPVEVQGHSQIVGQQVMRFAADDVAFKLTAFKSDNGRFEEHARRLLRHIDLKAMLWVNLNLERVSFTTLE